MASYKASGTKVLKRRRNRWRVVKWHKSNRAARRHVRALRRKRK